MGAKSRCMGSATRAASRKRSLTATLEEGMESGRKAFAGRTDLVHKHHVIDHGRVSTLDSHEAPILFETKELADGLKGLASLRLHMTRFPSASLRDSSKAGPTLRKQRVLYLLHRVRSVH